MGFISLPGFGVRFEWSIFVEPPVVGFLLTCTVPVHRAWDMFEVSLLTFVN